MILGVCEWLGHKMNVEPSALRIAFVVAILFFGAGLGLYLILFVVKMFDN